MCCGPEKENSSSERPVRRRVVQRIRIEPTNVAGTTTTTAISATTGAVTTNTVREGKTGSEYLVFIKQNDFYKWLEVITVKN